MDENQIKRLLSSLEIDDDITIEFENNQIKNFSISSIDHIDGQHYHIFLAGDKYIHILEYNGNEYIVKKKNTQQKKIIKSIQFDYN